MDLFADEAPRILPGRRLAAELTEVRIGDLGGFATRRVVVAELTHEGMAGDGHAGFTRKSGGREPWYPRGTVIRSGRQLSIVSEEELAWIAVDLGLPVLDPGLIGANMVIRGVPRLSFLPAGTRIVFAGGATVVVEGQNAPCRQSGRALAAAHPGRDDLELGFVTAGARRRGLVATVEKAGPVAAGAITLRIPEQWIYA